jgi:DNA-directed RNA polymerase subunit RPC12/RpoP
MGAATSQEPKLSYGRRLTRRIRIWRMQVASLPDASSASPTPLLSRMETLAQACPRCGFPLMRAPRHVLDRIISLIYPVRRYRCRGCPWEGLLKYRAP